MGAQRIYRRQRGAPARRSAIARAGGPASLPTDHEYTLHAAQEAELEAQPIATTEDAESALDEAFTQDSLVQRARAWLARRTWEQWAWFAVLLLAGALRFWDLGGKALHHDESMHAFYSLLFARDPSSYAYNPLLHGPFQFHAEGFMFMLLLAAESIFRAGAAGSHPWINDATARIVPALFGLGIVALPIGLRRELTRSGALIAGFLLAISPSYVYFSRFLREDIYFNFFMFAMVVCAVRFATSRRMLWLTLTAAATILAYATFEGIFLTLLIFIGFLVVVLVWEFAEILAPRFPVELSAIQKLLFTRAILFVALTGVCAIAASWALHTMRDLSTYITTHPTQSDANVALLEQRTVSFLLYLSIALALVVIIALVWQIARDNELYDRKLRSADFSELEESVEPMSEDATGRASMSLAKRIEYVIGAPGRCATRMRSRLDSDRQPLLNLLLGVSWTQWFVAFVTAWMIFVALFWEFPGAGRTIGQGFEEGIGHGVWQGLYYWLQQQDVARGGQPVYYYFLLIPLYEQLAVVLGIAGVVYSIVRPNRFRLFLVWWFLGSLAIYSWAGEKMPWLSIHILLPLMLLAAIAINRALQGTLAFARKLRAGVPAGGAIDWLSGSSVAGIALTVLLLIPMIHSMVVLTYKDPSNGPLEMMVYVQTTQDVDTVMAKIAQADQNLYGGKHQLKLVVGQGEEWPMYWYLRDYWLDPHPGFYVTWDPLSVNGSNPYTSLNPDALILLPGDQVQQFLQAHPKGYHMKEYILRSWFDESYKPQLACLQSGQKCPANINYALYGQGLGPWLTYGSSPPSQAKFNVGKVASRLWNWLWLRQPLGATTGPYYDFVFIVKDTAGVKP
ncbi:MAG TPA: flippase activity-associated protein Agl23 [Ktedonobacterales bacterium]